MSVSISELIVFRPVFNRVKIFSFFFTIYFTLYNTYGAAVGELPKASAYYYINI